MGTALYADTELDKDLKDAILPHIKAMVADQNLAECVAALSRLEARQGDQFTPYIYDAFVERINTHFPLMAEAATTVDCGLSWLDALTLLVKEAKS